MSKPTIEEYCNSIRYVIWQETDSEDNPVPEQAIIIKNHDDYAALQQGDQHVIVNISTLRPLAKLLLALAREME